MSKNTKTQINAWLSSPEGRESEVLRDMSQILYDDHIDFNLSVVGPDEEAGMQLVYLADEMKDVPIMIIKISMFVLRKKFNRIEIQDFFAKIAYKFSTGLKLNTPNKQYFIPTNIDDLIGVEVLHPGLHTEAEVEEMSKMISKYAKAIYNNPKDFPGSYFEELEMNDPNLGQEFKSFPGYSEHRLTHKGKPVTEWERFEQGDDYTEMIKKLHEQYKIKTLK